MGNTIVQKLAANKKLSSLEEDVLAYIVSHHDDILTMGIRQVATNTLTSTSTIMRLAKKLGFNGFVDMNYKLMPLLQDKSHKQAGSYTDLFSYNSLFELNSNAVFEAVAQALIDVDKQFVFVYANGFSGIIADYLHKKLLVLGKRVMFSTGNDSVGVFENNLDDIGVFITISKSGETLKVIEKVRTAVENDIPVIAFTNEIENTLSSYGKPTIKIKDLNKYDDYNASANSFFSHVLLAMEVIVWEYNQIIGDQLKEETSY